MIKVGLTGGIGSGKTTVAKFFVELGVPVYNSDKEAKRLMIASKSVKKAIIKLLGKKAYRGEKLNKKYISNQIFKDADLLKKMNAIVHPAVKNDFFDWMKKQNAPYVIQETALIFENSKHGSYDFIILVTAPMDVRIDRVVKRDGSSKKDVLDRIGHQLDDALKIPVSDYVIDNIELSKTKSKVAEVHLHLLANT